MAAEPSRRVFRGRRAGLFPERPAVVISIAVLVLAGAVWLAGTNLGVFLHDVHSPHRATRVDARLGLLVGAMLVAATADSLRRVLRCRRAPETGVVLDEEKLAITDEQGRSTEFRWYALEEVLAFPGSAEGLTNTIFILAGDRSEFIPNSTTERGELLAEILRRGQLTLRQEEPQFRRYSRTAEVSK